MTPKLAIEQMIIKCNNDLMNLEKRFREIAANSWRMQGEMNALRFALEQLDKVINKHRLEKFQTSPRYQTPIIWSVC